MNAFEEALFRVEDDRHEMDMLIETSNSALALLRGMMDRVLNLPETAQRLYSFSEEDAGPITLRAVERIYGRHGKEMRTKVLEAPAIALPIVIKRLEQKKQEWSAIWHDMQADWLTVDECNHKRSLDHRAVPFKRLDKKQFGTKGMMNELHEAWERSKEWFPTNSVAASEEHGDFVLKSGSRESFDDAFVVLAVYLQLITDRNTSRDMLEMWRTFFEPSWGVFRGADWAPLSDSTAHEAHKQVCEFLLVNGARDTEDDVPLDNQFCTGVQGNADERPAKVPRTREHVFHQSPYDVKPMTAQQPQHKEGEPGESARGIYANETIYLIFRLQGILMERMDAARACASSAEGCTEKTSSRNNLKRFFKQLFSFFCGLIDRLTFEDTAREVLGKRAYVVFVIDRLLDKIGRQLQARTLLVVVLPASLFQ